MLKNCMFSAKISAVILKRGNAMSKVYDIIPSQATMYLMQKYSLHKQITQIPASFMVDKELDFNLLTRALNIEIQRNDSLRVRFIKEDKKIKQTFLDSYKIGSVKVLTFKTEEEQNSYFAKDAQTPVRFLKGECYRIYFFNAYNGYKGIYLNVSHLCMDAMGMLVFFSDLLAVYKALASGSKKMPPALFKYEDYVEKELARLEDTERLKKDEEFYRNYFLKGGEPFYAGIHGPAFLEKARAKQKNPDLRVPAAYNPLYDKAEVIVKHVDTAASAKIFNFCKEHNVAPESLLLMGLRTYASKVNYRVPDIFMQLMCSKRITYKDMRTGGCMAQPLQIRTIISEDKTFSEALDEFLTVRAQLYRHLTYPYITARDLSRELYNYSMIQGPACMMFSWLPVPVEDFGGIKVDFRTYNLGRYFTPLYTICYPEPKSGGLVVNYMYRVKLISPENIEDLHRNMVNVILKGIENPDITIGELLDCVDR